MQLVLSVALAAGGSLTAQTAQPLSRTAIQPEAWQIVALTNQARAAQGAPPLQWDPALALAARQHCLRMAQEGPIAHRYGDEPDLGDRAGQAGAHFSLIEENVAIGPSPAAIHDEWMHSEGHRTNMLNPNVDRVGVALVASRGVLYAVADYAKGVPALTPEQVEARVAALVRVSGVVPRSNPADARTACAMDHGVPLASAGPQPGFVMRWQDANVTRLPQKLVDQLASGQYHEAAIGSCPAQVCRGCVYGLSRRRAALLAECLAISLRSTFGRQPITRSSPLPVPEAKARALKPSPPRLPPRSPAPCPQKPGSLLAPRPAASAAIRNASGAGLLRV